MKKEKLYSLVLVLSLAGFIWLAWNISGEHQVFHVCLIKQITGLPCPSCGTTRGLVQLAQGHVLESFLLNPFALILGFALFVFPIWIFIDAWKKKESFFFFYLWVDNMFSKYRLASILAVVLVGLNWYWNIIKGF
jgi:hypothetical protein